MRRCPKSCSTVTEIDPTGSICTHFAQCLSAGNANLCLRLRLIRSKMRSLCLLVLGILAFFTLDSHFFNIICCFCLNSRCCNILSDSHQLRIAIACLVQLDCPYIDPGNSSSEAFFQLFADVIFNSIINQCSLALDLNQRNIVRRRSIGNSVLHIAGHGIADLLLKIFKIKSVQPM